MKTIFKYDAFISYSRKDIAFTIELQSTLEKYFLILNKESRKNKSKIHIIRDESDFDTSENTTNEVYSKIAESKHLIVVCSEFSRGNSSVWVNKEIAFFNKNRRNNNSIDTDRKIIPILINPSHPLKNNDLPKELENIVDLPLGLDFSAYYNNKKRDKDYNEKILKIISTILNIPFNEFRSRQKIHLKQKRKERIVITSAISIIIVVVTLIAAVYSIIFVSSSPIISNIKLREGNYSTAVRNISADKVLYGHTSGNIFLVDQNAYLDTLRGLSGIVNDIVTTPNSIIAASVDSDFAICWDRSNYAEKWKLKNPKGACFRVIKALKDRIALAGDDGNLWISDFNGQIVDSLIISKNYGKILDMDIDEQQAKVAFCLENFGFILYNYKLKKIDAKIDLTEKSGFFTSISLKDDFVLIGCMDKVGYNTLANGRLISVHISKEEKKYSNVYEYSFEKFVKTQYFPCALVSDQGGTIRVIRFDDATEITNWQVNPNFLGDGRFFGFNYFGNTIYVANFLGELKQYNTHWKIFGFITFPIKYND